MSGQHDASPERRTGGWRLWFARCRSCGWFAEAEGREDAAALAKRHNTEKAATEPCHLHEWGYGDCGCPA